MKCECPACSGYIDPNIISLIEFGKIAAKQLEDMANDPRRKE